MTYKNCLSFYREEQTRRTDRKNLFPENLINKCFSQFILNSVKGSKTQPHSGIKLQETPEFHYKIPYIAHFSVIAQNKIRKLANRFCKPTRYFQHQEFVQRERCFPRRASNACGI